MGELILKAENISKQYRLGTVGSGSLRDDFKRSWAKMRGKDDPFLKVGAVNERSIKSTEDYVWALRDINFEVRQGEVLGIIGKNGAGKSTLLKILSRVTAPTTGVIKSRGRIASLLEVGTGFHHELTGRENIYLNGAILGMTKAEINSKLDEIIEFSGCERYIDTPTKRYSSGMTVRLAFAVAAHLEPEILVVDEVLAVGDAEFQKKAIGKMQDISQGQGRTVLFVSHNMDSILRLCSKSLLLKNGAISNMGETAKIVDFYLQEEYKALSWKEYSDIFVNDQKVQIHKVSSHDAEYNNLENYKITEKVGITLTFAILEDGVKVQGAFNFYNANGLNIFDSHESGNETSYLPKKKGIYSTTVWIYPNLFSEGVIIVGAALVTQNPFKVHFHDREAIVFNMMENMGLSETRGEYVGNLPGILRPKFNWSTRKIDNTYV